MTRASNSSAENGNGTRNASGGDRRFVPTPAARERQVVMDADAIRRALVRIAHEILEHHADVSRLVLVGMRTRGVPLGERIAEAILRFEGVTVATGALDISLHRDDLSMREFPPTVHPSDLPESLDDRVIVLLDDVLFTGRSIRAALDALIDYGRPAAIELAVLVDRGHRELPIRPDYVGKNLPTQRSDVVEVLLTETDDIDAVVVRAGVEKDGLKTESDPSSTAATERRGRGS
jgi:pyrimidine operon attenuation protein/uracil phosphoribosyltransferase